MVEPPRSGGMAMKIFLSAVSGQFPECRRALSSDFYATGADVKVQEKLQQGGYTLLEALRAYIDGCDRVLALARDTYGIEPDESARPSGRPGRSYTQWGYFFARGERLDGSEAPARLRVLRQRRVPGPASSAHRSDARAGGVAAAVPRRDP